MNQSITMLHNMNQENQKRNNEKKRKLFFFLPHASCSFAVTRFRFVMFQTEFGWHGLEGIYFLEKAFLTRSIASPANPKTEPRPNDQPRTRTV